jgi:hypothetical protein
MKKNLSFLLLTAVLWGFASCGRVTVLSESSSKESHQQPSAWSVSESQGDQQESRYRPQVWEADAETGGHAAIQEARKGITASEKDGASSADAAAAGSAEGATNRETAYGTATDDAESRRASRARRSRVERISKKDPFGERYAQASELSVGVHNPANRARGALSASSIMEAAPAPALAQARQRYDFNDPLYLALFIILVVLALLLAILIIAETISALGLIGVLLLAALIIALVILL